MKSPAKAASQNPVVVRGVTTINSSHSRGDLPTNIIVPWHAETDLSLGNGTKISMDDFREVKKEQRNSHNFYDSKFFFPTMIMPGNNLTDEDRQNRQSYRRALRFLCLGMQGCQNGDCLKALQDSDVCEFRKSTKRRQLGRSGKEVPWKQIMVEDLQRCWNRTTESWEPIGVAVDGATTIKLCPQAYGLLCGCAPTTLRNALEAIKYSEVRGGTQLSAFVPVSISGVAAREQRSEDWCLLRAYVADLVNKHEANPAPGAHQPGRMTHMNKSTWKSKWAAVEVFFKNAARVPGSKSMLKNVWKLETRLKEKKACSHSKCSICSKIDAGMDELRGLTHESAKQDRENFRKAQAEHDEMHLASRTELDLAGLHAFVDPNYMWTILVDAATQRNFMLPKFKFRTPKNMAQMPFWSYKLMASYAYGYGFTPFLVHSSQHMGANLSWTVLWLTLCRMRTHYGYWPKVLHITVDNTTGENKNETLLAMCAWIVAAGYVSQVRVLFLMVGHTHVIIDHIFGVITVGLRRKEMVLPEHLQQNIDGSLAANPQYMAKPCEILHCLWDFKAWVKEQLVPAPLKNLFKAHVQDAEGAYNGMYDLLFTSGGTGKMPRLQYREHVSHPWLPEGSAGAEVITKMPSSPPNLQEIKSYSEWGMEGTKSVMDTIVVFLDVARSLNQTDMSKIVVRQMWQGHRDRIPTVIALLNPELKLNFEFFADVRDDVPRLGQRGAPGGTGAEEDARYEEWKRQHINLKTNPLAIDPVVSSEQSNAEVEQMKRALQTALRAGNNLPTSVRTTPIFLGGFVLAYANGGLGVDLYNVATIDNNKNAYAIDLSFRGILYEHLPNPEVSGLFGTFKMKLSLNDGRRQQTRITLHRSQVVVYNAHIDKKRKVLSLRTLRALALVMPNAYPFPARPSIPESHVDFSDDEDDQPAGADRQPCRSGKRKAAPASNGGRGKGRGGRAGRSGRGRARSKNVSSEEEEDDEEDDDDDDDEDDEEVSSEPDVPESSSGSDADDVFDADEHVLPTAPDEPRTEVPMLQGPTVELKLDTVVALNMVNDPEYEQFMYPVALAYVCSIDPFKVYWFVVPVTQLAPRIGKEKARPFKSSNKFLTYTKFWKNPFWFGRSRKNFKPTEAQILEQWYVSDAHRNWVLPVEIPNEDGPLKVRMTDQFKIRMDFVKSTLIPACEAAHCKHGK